MNKTFFITIIILVLLLCIYYLHKKRTQLLSEHYNDYCMYDSNLDKEKKLDADELSKLLTKPGQFKLLRDMSVAELQKEIEYAQYKQLRTTDDFASYGLLKSIIEASDEENARYIQDQYKQPKKKTTHNSKTSRTITTQNNNIETFSSDTNTGKKEVWEYGHKDEDGNVTKWQLEKPNEYEYIYIDKDKKDNDDEWVTDNDANKRKEDKKILLLDVEDIIDTWLSHQDCKLFQTPKYLHHFKRSYHNYMIYKFSETIKYLPSVDNPIEMTFEELSTYRDILLSLPNCKTLMKMYDNNCNIPHCSPGPTTTKKKHKKKKEKNKAGDKDKDKDKDSELNDKIGNELDDEIGNELDDEMGNEMSNATNTEINNEIKLKTDTSQNETKGQISTKIDSESKIQIGNNQISAANSVYLNTILSKQNNIGYSQLNSNTNLIDDNKETNISKDTFKRSGSHNVINRDLHIRSNSQLDVMAPFDPLFSQCSTIHPHLQHMSIYNK